MPFTKYVQNIILKCKVMRSFQISCTNYILSKIIRFAISYLLNHALPLGMLIKGENTIISSLVFILLVVTVTHIDRFDIFCPTHVCRFSFLFTQWVVPEVYAWLANRIKTYCFFLLGRYKICYVCYFRVS